MTHTPETIFSILAEISDPEIPVLSIVDLGIIHSVKTHSEKHVDIIITPTFVGCPAIDAIKDEITAKLQAHGFEQIAVDVDLSIPWSSDQITEKGKLALKTYGIAPPVSQKVFSEADLLERLQHIHCPQCDGTNTEIQSPFGTTLCRTIHYCHSCRQSFEHMKHI
jgi:ring-1,2-phenylacetyl-CoA epoxidase subunit PaaD